MTTDRNEHRLALAQEVAHLSNDSTKVGAIISGPDGKYLAHGYNRLPTSITATEERTTRPAKYKWTEHAERVAIYKCARQGRATAGATIAVNWFPCAECARAIIEAGIVEVIGRQPDFTHPKYGEDFTIAVTMFQEAGIKVTCLSAQD